MVLEQCKSAFNPFWSPMEVDSIITFGSEIEAKKDHCLLVAAGECLSQDLLTNCSGLYCCFLFENSPVFTRKTKSEGYTSALIMFSECTKTMRVLKIFPERSFNRFYGISPKHKDIKSCITSIIL